MLGNNLKELGNMLVKAGNTIERQKEEIERLRRENDALKNGRNVISKKEFAEKILDEAIRKHKNAIDDWKEYERCKKENNLVSAETYLRKFQDGISYSEGIYNALVTIGFTHPKMKEFSDML